MNDEELNLLTRKIIGFSIDIHTALGPGLLESAYKACLFYKISQSGLYVEKEKPIPLYYKGVRLDCGYRIDLLINDQLVIEVSLIDQISNAFYFKGKISVSGKTVMSVHFTCASI